MRRHHKHHMGYTAAATFEAPHHHYSLRAGKRTKLVNVMGKGGETRHTETRLPGNYVLESRKPEEGYETVWTLNVHGLDTRGAVNRMGCAECRFVIPLNLPTR
jgi:hypothetical protein